MKYYDPNPKHTIGEMTLGALLRGPKTLEELQGMCGMAHPKNVEAAVKEMLEMHRISSVVPS